MIILTILDNTVPVLLSAAFYLSWTSNYGKYATSIWPHVSGIGGVLQPFLGWLKIRCQRTNLPLSAYGML
jgi:hypothetical protein